MPSQAQTLQLSEAQAAQRAAVELGAEKDPVAQIHAKLAQDALDKANLNIKDEKFKRAEYQIKRAKADAELAVALARENKSRLALERATTEAKEQASTNTSQGAK